MKVFEVFFHMTDWSKALKWPWGKTWLTDTWNVLSSQTGTALLTQIIETLLICGGKKILSVKFGLQMAKKDLIFFNNGSLLNQV